MTVKKKKHVIGLLKKLASRLKQEAEDMAEANERDDTKTMSTKVETDSVYEDLAWYSRTDDAGETRSN